MRGCNWKKIAWNNALWDETLLIFATVEIVKYLTVCWQQCQLCYCCSCTECINKYKNIWNNLPADLRLHSQSLLSFGQKLKQYLFEP